MIANYVARDISTTARTHPLAASILIFLLLYASIVWASPSFAFDAKGKARQFGIGITGRTVTPVWLIVIVLAVLSYLLVLYASNIVSPRGRYGR